MANSCCKGAAWGCGVPMGCGARGSGVDGRRAHRVGCAQQIRAQDFTHPSSLKPMKLKKKKNAIRREEKTGINQ